MLKLTTLPVRIIAAVICALAANLTAAEESDREILENKLVRVGIDAAGDLTDLCNLRTGWNYAGKQPLWRIFYTESDVRDIEASAVGAPTVTANGSSITVRYASLQSPKKQPLEIAVEFKVGIERESDDLRWTITVANRQPGVVVTEVQFPLVGDIRLRPGQALIMSQQGGRRFPDPKDFVKRSHTAYMGSDQNGVKAGGMYPGYQAGTNCFVFDARGEGLYFGSHDPSLQNTLHLWRLWKDQMQVGFVKYPFLATGGKYASADFLVSPYSGTWHVAAKKYRDWVNTWFHPPQKPDWLKKMNGWQRIILKHQYGELMHPYDTIATMGAVGRASGIESLLLFGWWKDGMDAGYPDYDVDEAQGGREVFAAQIRKARDEGTRVQLYFNGRLIDKESAFYRSGEGKRVAIKDLRGNEWNESYHFRGDGTTTWQFGRKTFVVACPTDRSWQKRRLEWTQKALSLGADAVFFDQMGMNEIPCTDPTHGHPVPLTSFANDQLANLREIREYVRRINPEAVFGTEHLTDLVASECDYLHSLGVYGANGFIEWYRYLFPEVPVSDREIYDDNDIERRVNFLLTRGLRSDVCVWRCRGTLADTPHYAKYLGKVNALRNKHSQFLLEGVYCDNEPLQLDSEAVDGRAFRSGNRLMVAMTQSTATTAAAVLRVPGYKFVGADGLDDYRVEPHGDGLRVSVKKNAVALAIFERL